MGRWQPYGGEAVSRALFLHRTGGPSTGETVFVATGGRGDTEVHIHRLKAICTAVPSFDDPRCR